MGGGVGIRIRCRIVVVDLKFSVCVKNGFVFCNYVGDVSVWMLFKSVGLIIEWKFVYKFVMIFEFIRIRRDIIYFVVWVFV